MKVLYITECEDGGYATVDNTNGIGNVVPPQSAGQSAASQTDNSCIGSGDRFGEVLNKKKTQIYTNECNLSPFDEIGQGIAKKLNIKPVFTEDKSKNDGSIISNL